MRAICCSFCGEREGLEADRTAELIAAKELGHFICIYCLKLFLKACQKREIIVQTCEGSTIAEKNLHCSFCLHPPKEEEEEEEYFFTNNRDSYICESCLVRADLATNIALTDCHSIDTMVQFDDPHQLRHRKENSALEASSEVLSQVSAQDLARFGLVPEFIGRIPIISVLSPLDEEALINILTTLKNAIIKQFQKLFQYNGTQLEFDDTALQAIAKRALKQQTGARGLRSIIEHLLLDIMYELPEKAIKKVIITGRTVEDSTPPLIDYHKQEQIIANNEAPLSGSGLSAEEIRKFQSIFE